MSVFIEASGETDLQLVFKKKKKCISFMEWEYLFLLRLPEFLPKLQPASTFQN